MSIYWLVNDDNKGPLALVKVTENTAVVIAGSNLALKGFEGGTPNSLISESWYFDLLTDKPYHGIVGEWIDELGPAEDSALRLKKLREKEAKQKTANAKRARALNLSEAELAEIQELLIKDVSQNHIADKYRVSKSFIHRLEASKHRNVPKVRGSDSEALEATDIAALQGANIARVGVSHE
ncbi:MAG: hypothetical protein O2971_13235 [Proteobacteria bacterium]|nr:hypothetical protein [Pseudomonadota bacterium]